MRFNINTEIRAEIRDPNGRVVKTLPWKPANSLLKQFIQLLMVQMNQANETIKDTAGVDRSVPTAAGQFQANLGAGVTNRGIIIGTGTNAVTMADYQLQSQAITNVTHAAMTLAIENPDAATWRIALARVLTNNTGSTLAVREVGLSVSMGATAWPGLIDRTLYSVDVPNGTGVTLTYRITITL